MFCLLVIMMTWLKAFVRQLISDDFKYAFEKCDLILTPTTPNVAFPIGENKVIVRNVS